MLKKNVLLTILTGVILLSVFLNFLMYKKIMNLYTREQEALLEPVHTSKNVYKNSDTIMRPESVLLIGDSRIAQWSPELEINKEIINYGVGGETTIQLYYRVKKESELYKSDLIIIQTGINDLKAIGLLHDRKDEIVLNCFENIKEIALMLSDSRKVILLTIFPHSGISLFRKPVWDNSITEAIKQVNAKLLNLNLPNVYVIDCDSILSGKNNLLDPSFSYDDLHLNQTGYKNLNNYLKPKIDNYLKSYN